MSFTFRPAVRERTSVLIGIAGASGSGKTFSALQLASGLAGPDGKVAVIDTEAGRALHYADQFRFDHGDLTPPFSPKRYMEAIAAADAAGYDVVVIDSMSHEYEGEGGILEWAQRLADGVPKVDRPRTYGAGWQDDWEVAPVKSPGNWKEPKAAHKRMVNRLLQTRAHLIFCMRAEEKMRVEQVPVLDHRGQPKTRQDGSPITTTKVIAAEEIPLEERWHAICEKRFPYELTASFLLLPSAPGVPVPLKLQEQHRHAFPDRERITRESGDRLRAWATNGSAPSHTAPALDAAGVFDEAKAEAEKGLDAFRAWWTGPGKDPAKRAAIADRMPELQKIAEDADVAPAAEGALV